MCVQRIVAWLDDRELHVHVAIVAGHVELVLGILWRGGGPADVGRVGRQLADHLASGVVPVHPKPRGLALQRPGLVAGGAGRREAKNSRLPSGATRGELSRYMPEKLTTSGSVQLPFLTRDTQMIDIGGVVV